MENLKTVKQFADYAGVTVQSVYKRLQTPANAAALEGHVIKRNGSTYLDEYAVQFLNENRAAAFAASPAAQQERMITELATKAQQLQQENDDLKNKLLDALERLTAATQAAGDHKAALIEARGQIALLEAKHEAADQLRHDLQEKDQELRVLTGRLQVMEARKDDVEALRKRLEDESLEYREMDVQNQHLMLEAQEADQARQKAEERAASLLDENLQQLNTIDELQAEVRRLKERGFLDRLFNR